MTIRANEIAARRRYAYRLRQNGLRPTVPPRCTYQTAVQEFYNDMLFDVKATTRQLYIAALRNYFADLVTLNVETIAARYRQRRAHLARVHSRMYLHRQYKMLRRFCQYLVERGLLPRNPLFQFAFARSPHSPRTRAFQDADYKQIQTHLHNQTGRAAEIAGIMKLVRLTGMRTAEVLALSKADLSATHISINAGKGGKQRIIPYSIIPGLAEHCAHLREQAPKGKKLFSIGYRCTVSRYIREAARQCGIPTGRRTLTLMGLRVTQINWMRDTLKFSADLRALIAGHSIQVEAESYLHRQPTLAALEAMAPETLPPITDNFEGGYFLYS